MTARPPELKRVVLIGFSATGKSVLAPYVAERLGWRVVDLDVEIEREAGRPIPAIFEREGEAGFRAREREAVREAAQIDGAVIASGGGVWLDPENRAALAEQGFVITLEARPSTILARYAATEQGRPEVRPLLAGADPRRRVESLKAQRQPFYALADLTLHTDEPEIGELVEEIVAAVERGAGRALDSDSRLRAMREGPGVAPPPVTDFGPDVACVVDAGASRYPVYTGWDLLGRLGEIFDRLGLSRRVFLIADGAVIEGHGETAAQTLRDSGRQVFSYRVEPGEASKSLECLAELYAWLAERRAERSDVILALGGGVTTDLAGTAAATYLRGMAMVHAPTTMLGMVDAAIGGKVAVDLPAGKNLVGAFYQPRAVICDLTTLATLPRRELRSGYAEVIKHALIREPQMLDELERHAVTLLNPAAARANAAAAEIIADMIRRNQRIKARVVSADEREADVRAILNYGHTLGHAIEAVTGFRELLHGEAVAIGLVAAAEIGHAMGLIDESLLTRHRTLLEHFGLPVRTPAPLDAGALLEAMSRDKKVVGGRQRWVLLESAGAALVRDDVPPSVVLEAIDAVASVSRR